MLLLIGLIALTVSGCNFLRGYASGRSQAMLVAESVNFDATQRGQLRFIFDDLNGLNTDTLETNALPWKITVTALLLYAERDSHALVDRKKLPPLLKQYGFVVPDRIANWSGDHLPPTFNQPLGIVTGRVERRLPHIALEVANLGCATCHAGVMYDASGLPNKDIWLGLPNTSINLEAYTKQVYVSMQHAVRDPQTLLVNLYRLFPDTDEAERRTLEKFVLPRMQRRLAEIARGVNAPMPFSNGGPGMTNGVAALKLQLGLIAHMTLSAEYGFTSIPDLGSVLLRSSLLYDGAYAPPGVERYAARAAGPVTNTHLQHMADITTFFTVPTMGVPPDTAFTTVARVKEILQFVAQYDSPRFPGSVDKDLALRGRDLYRQHCAACHGEYSQDLERPRLLSFPNHFSPQADMDTDPARWQAIDAPLVEAIRSTQFGNYIVAGTTGGYVAPRLSALWATAPYLHNGSVPTLWHLMNTSQRPKKFYVGGHKLDFAKLGVAGELDVTGTWRYTTDYVPWSTPALYDTQATGQSNGGHAKEFLPIADDGAQKSLLEYLKLL